jgi:hypothetical protein
LRPGSSTPRSRSAARSVSPQLDSGDEEDSLGRRLVAPRAGFGVTEQTATITANGWRANVRNLGVGRHLITTTVGVDGDTFPFHHVIDITPPG